MSAPPSRRLGGVVRRLTIGLNTGASLGLAALLLLMVNYLSFRHYARWDWSRAQLYRLSDKTRGLLRGLTNTLDAAVFFQPDHPLYEDVDRLLREYEAAAPRLRVERVDPDRDLARAEELMRRYELTEANVVVFDMEGLRRQVRADELADYDLSPLQYGRRPVRVSFKGEQAFSTALHGLAQRRRPVVYFLAGHGERDIAGTARGVGYSEVAGIVRRDNAEARVLTLGEARRVPDDADAVIVAGPEKRFGPAELDILRDYLERKGRMMFLLDAMTRPGLETLLDDWGVRLADDVVLDATRTLTGRELFLTAYEPHPITRSMAGMTSVLYLPRSVEPAEDRPGGGPEATPLAFSSESGWAETDFDQTPMRYDPESDRPGPISVAVAVEQGRPPGLDVDIRPTRLVVFGDSDFVANGAMTGGNEDLFMNSLNWLLDRQDLLAIAPKPLEESRLVLTQPELRALFWALVAGLPACWAAVGGLVALRRRT